MKEGLKRLLRFVRYEIVARVLPPPPTPYEHVKDLPRYQPVTVRLFGKPFVAHDGSMFHGQYKEIVKGEAYRFESANPEPRIIDCGANGGLSIAYFKRIHPRACITGVEADPTIFRVLTSNVASQELDGVRLVHGAVSGRPGRVSFFSEGSDSGRTHALAGARAVCEVEAVLLDDLIDGPVDLLKIDIEGAETDALLACAKIGMVDRLFIEYHSFRDQEQRLHDLLKYLAANGFRYYVRTAYCPPNPLLRIADYLGMDLQLNIYGVRRG